MQIGKLAGLIKDWYQKGLHHVEPLLIVGPIGVGKSSCVREAAEELGVGYIDLRLSQLDSVDFRGIPTVVGGWTEFNPPRMLPFEGTEWPEKGILFLDEITLGDRLVRACAYQLILDRCIGSRRIKDGWAILAATNRMSDKCDIDELPAALRNRFLRVDVSADVDDFAAYMGDKTDVAVQYLLSDPKQLQGSVENESFATPRSWERVSKTVRALGADDKRLPELVTGLVGTVSDSFMKFLKSGGTTAHTIYEQILAGKRAAGLKTTEIDEVFALASKADNAELTILLAYAFEHMEANHEKIGRVHEALKKSGVIDREAAVVEALDAAGKKAYWKTWDKLRGYLEKMRKMTQEEVATAEPTVKA